jgi:hypothetical protein
MSLFFGLSEICDGDGGAVTAKIIDLGLTKAVNEAGSQSVISVPGMFAGTPVRGTRGRYSIRSILAWRDALDNAHRRTEDAWSTPSRWLPTSHPGLRNSMTAPRTRSRLARLSGFSFESRKVLLSLPVGNSTS